MDKTELTGIDIVDHLQRTADKLRTISTFLETEHNNGLSFILEDIVRDLELATHSTHALVSL